MSRSLLKSPFVVVVTYNGMQWIDSCIESLQGSACSVSIIIVDNASQDGTPEHIKEKFHDVELIHSGENLGFGQANNKGIKQALDKGAEYIFLLNQDARIESDTIGTLVNTHEKHPEFAVLSPVHLNGKGDRLDGGFQNYAGPEYTDELLNDLLLKKDAEVYATRFVNATAWMLSRKCLERVGGFDPIFFHYGEDYNYCQRVQYHEMKVGIVPSARIFHDRVYKQELYGPEQIYRHFLLKVADINNESYKGDKQKHMQQDRIRMITGLMHGDLKKFRQNYQNLRRKRKNMAAIEESRRKNKKGGMLYI
jgi:GT2 family glycosyltransferase